MGKNTSYEEQIQEWIAGNNEEAILYPDLNGALIGICEQFGRPPVAAYDLNKCITLLMEDGMDEDEAMDYFYFNTLGTWAGDSTPVFITMYED